jgi:predicted nucleic acid-binding Zn ribbon protein
VRRAAPRPLARALADVAAGAAPATALARIQERWPDAAGPEVAREARPVAERDGVVTLACRSAVWAQELELLAGELAGRLNDALEREGAGRPVRGLKAVVRRHEPGP